MKNTFTILVFSLLVAASLDAQVLQTSTFLGHKTRQQLVNQFNSSQFKNGVNFYKVTYLTPDVTGNLAPASGLVVVPDDLTKIYPLLCYQHGTASSDSDIPSALAQEADLVMVYGGMGYIAVAPDYLGFGASEGFHPYVHAATEASAAIDLLRATKELADENNVFFNEQLFVTGYSQGGHAAMALHRELETNLSAEFTVTAAAPMSGPYSVGEIMRELVLAEEEYFFPAYIPNTVLSYQLMYGNLYTTLDEIFKADYVNNIQKFRDDELDLVTLNYLLNASLFLNEGAIIPVRMFQDSVIEAILTDSLHPFNLALKANNVYDWAPAAPTTLVYCTADDQVPFANALLAESVMNANGATAVGSIDIQSDASHVECVTPAAFLTIFFFSIHQMIGIAPVNTTGAVASALDFSPNPVSGDLLLKNVEPESTLKIMDAQGRVWLVQALPGGDQMITTAQLPVGCYFLQVMDNQGVKSGKLMVQR